MAAMMLFRGKIRMRHRFKWDQDEIWQECSSHECESINRVFFDSASYLQDGGYYFISRKKVLPPGE